MRSKVARLLKTGLDGETFRYIAATGLSACLSLLLPILLHEIIGLSEKIAVGSALLVTMLINFVMLRTYVFRSSGPANRQVMGFFATSGLFRLGEYGLFLFLIRFFDLYYMAALLISLIISFCCKYMVQRFFIFR